jgi:hypothetical protein
MVKIEISGTCWETRRAPKEIFILIMNNAQGPNHIFRWDKLSENLSSLPPTFFCHPKITFFAQTIYITNIINSFNIILPLCTGKMHLDETF